ncbi:hypothetical protein PVAND_001748 [Polypedilum vanderplanki]|uniref:Uncharacterized protein n=1 Tax=Polypedilum vanderplanki TaxID=319348 RepID=A0A9J6BQ59_POLVA|nr:hypothetical protein PVAND_001748 [Polypedilum vanderplanki]
MNQLNDKEVQVGLFYFAVLFLLILYRYFKDIYWFVCERKSERRRNLYHNNNFIIGISPPPYSEFPLPNEILLK